MQGKGLPGSYKDILPDGSNYWASKTYLEAGAFNSNGTKEPLDSIIAIQERTLTRFGLNLYDAATWEMALALYNRPDVGEVYERNILYTGGTGAGGRANGNPGGLASIRGDLDGFSYGPTKIAASTLKQITYPGNVTHFTQDPSGKPSKDGVKKGPGAMFYRMIAPKYQMIDPMDGNYANSWKYPWQDPDPSTIWNKYGLIHFNDWKPITGENVWGAILGPIQNLALKTGGNLTNTTCGDPFANVMCDWSSYDMTPPAVQLGISILPGLDALYSDTYGSLFHCPWGSKIDPYDPNEGLNVSNENNASGLAALRVLLAVLQNYTKGTSDEMLTYATTTTEKLIKGLEKWFSNNQWLSPEGEIKDAQFAYQGGHILPSGYVPVPLTDVGGIAVDCQTWGMTVLGAPFVDKLHGDGASYKIWQGTKKYTGYFVGGKIAGVGYTAIVENKTVAPNNGIWSAEWTFGAINMAQVLAQQYAEMGHSDYHDSLMADAQSMYDAIVKPWPAGLQFSDGSYVYANKRFLIPWGWYSNPIGALCSTSWSVFQERNYNPFVFGGGNKPALKQPPTPKFDKPSTIH